MTVSRLELIVQYLSLIRMMRSTTNPQLIAHLDRARSELHTAILRLDGCPFPETRTDVLCGKCNGDKRACKKFTLVIEIESLLEDDEKKAA